MSRGGARWGIFVHDPDGDSGYGCIIGAYKSASLADDRADKITQKAERDGKSVECIVLPLLPGSTAMDDIIDRVLT